MPNISSLRFVLKKVREDDPHLQVFLSEGYEPFAVTTEEVSTLVNSSLDCMMPYEVKSKRNFYHLKRIRND